VSLDVLEVEVLLGEHFGAVVGTEGGGYLKKAMEETAKTRELLEDSYRRTGDIRKSTEEITKLFLAGAPENFLSPEVVGIVAGQMVRHIAKTMKQQSEVGNRC